MHTRVTSIARGAGHASAPRATPLALAVYLRRGIGSLACVQGGGEGTAGGARAREGGAGIARRPGGALWL
eukprot:COSAG02_NODE_22_length_53020_cov_16.223125_40_plen_70_part_00